MLPLFDADFDLMLGQVLLQLGHELEGNQLSNYQMVHGGCISMAVRVQLPGQELFLKYQSLEPYPDAYEKEALGLQLLAATHTVAVPQVLGHGRADGMAFMALPYFDDHFRKPHYWAVLGQQLAALHRHSQPHCGLHFNNYIGALPQQNLVEEPVTDVVEFYAEHRIMAQAGLALYEERLPRKLFDQIKALCQRLPQLLPAGPPALLHGDLWSGNVITDAQGLPLLIDPAPYYGPREAEIAFTKLFGGFEEAFYAEYEAAWPLEPGFHERVDLYNLYPLLVHVNLFGGSYLQSVERIVRRWM